MDAKLITACVSLGLAVTALVLMASGWHSRRKRQIELGHLAEVPERYDRQVPLTAFTGTYVSTTLTGDLLNRLTVDSLGYKAAATVFIFDDSVVISRRGARDLWIPGKDILAVGTVAGMAGKFVERNGLVLLTWSFNGTSVDTGLRLQYAREKKHLLTALENLMDSVTSCSMQTSGRTHSSAQSQL